MLPGGIIPSLRETFKTIIREWRCTHHYIPDELPSLSHVRYKMCVKCHRFRKIPNDSGKANG